MDEKHEWQEDVIDKIVTGDYIIYKGFVWDIESEEKICSIEMHLLNK